MIPFIASVRLRRGRGDGLRWWKGFSFSQGKAIGCQSDDPGVLDIPPVFVTSSMPQCLEIKAWAHRFSAKPRILEQCCPNKSKRITWYMQTTKVKPHMASESPRNTAKTTPRIHSSVKVWHQAPLDHLWNPLYLIKQPLIWSREPYSLPLVQRETLMVDKSATEAHQRLPKVLGAD